MVKRPPFFASVFAVAGVLVLCTLGLWQLDRLAWKRGILEQIEAAARAPLSGSALLTYDDFTSPMAFSRGRAAGRFVGPDIPLAPRTLEGQPGYHLYRVFQLQTGGFILVNRGWAGLDYQTQNNAMTMFFDAFEGDTALIKGIILPVPQPNYFTAENDLERWSWYRIDAGQIEEALALKDKLAPMILQLEKTDSDSAGVVPLGLGKMPNNNHLQYAMFWFAMAGVLMIIFFIRFVKQQSV